MITAMMMLASMTPMIAACTRVQGDKRGGKERGKRRDVAQLWGCLSYNQHTNEMCDKSIAAIGTLNFRITCY